jgi:hypothetical protein
VTDGAVGFSVTGDGWAVGAAVGTAGFSTAVGNDCTVGSPPNEQPDKARIATIRRERAMIIIFLLHKPNNG